MIIGNLCGVLTLIYQWLMVFYSQLDGSVLQVCGEWFQSVRSSDPSDALLCLLLLTATLERALGDVCPMLNVHSQRVYYSYTVF